MGFPGLKFIMKFKKKQLIDVQYAPYEEMFSGFNKIQAITFSYDLSFINNIMKYFDTAEIILGAKFIFDKDEMLPRLLADAAALKNDITKDKRLSNMLKNGDLIIKVSTSIVDHRKLYILSADDGRTRVLSPSANLSWSAWNGSHLENYEYDDGEAGYEDAINDFEVAWSLAEEIPYACFSAKISENADEDIVAGNPIVTKIKQTNSVIVLRQQMDEETISLTRRCLDIENDIAEYKEVTKNIGLKTDKGVTMISPQHVKKIETNMKRTNGIINYMYDVEHREDGYYPDVMAISSQTIIDILTDYGYDIPNYVKRLTWNDDYSVNSVSVSEDFLEQIDSLYRTNRKDFKIDTVTNLVSIELGRNKNIEKMFESWSRSLPNEIGATVIPSRDLCRIDFRKDKLEKFLGHSLSTGFLSFLQGKIGFGR